MAPIVFYFKKPLSLTRLVFFVFFDCVIHFLKIPSQKQNKILLIRLDAIGDFFLWLDQAKEYRKIYPDKKICLVANQVWSELAAHLPYWDEVISVDIKKYTRNPVYRIKKNNELSRVRFDKVINPTYSRSFLLSDSIVRMSKAEEKVGFDGNLSNIRAWQKKISDRWYTKLVPSSPDEKMELVRNAEFLRGLGHSGFKANVPAWPFSTELPDKIKEQLPNSYYIVFPGAGAKFRQWPLDNFIQLAQHISASSSLRPIFCGGPDEQQLGEYLENYIPDAGPNLIAKTSLEDLVAIISKASFVIANETSAVHIATAVDTPSICILGGGHFGRFMPYQVEGNIQSEVPKAVYTYKECFGCDWDRTCLPREDKTTVVPCIQDISVEQVWEHVQALIEKTSIRLN